MATTTDRYIVEVSAKLVGDEVFATLTNRMQQLQRENAALKKNLNQTGVAFRDIQKTGGNAAAGLSRFGSLFQNVSYQITDFAVQTTNGVDALRAFSQQAPQVAGALGAAGIGGAAGIATFAIASLAAALAPAVIAMVKGADAASELSKELESIEDRSIDIGAIFGAAEDPAADLKNLTAQGEQFRKVLVGINNVQRQQTLDLLQERLRTITNEFRGMTETMRTTGQGAGAFYSNITAGLINTRNIEELNSAFGLTIEQAKELQPLIQEVINPPDGKQNIEVYAELLRVFSTIKVEGEEAQKNVKEIAAALLRIITLNVQGGGFDLGGSDDDIKTTEKLNREWDQIVASLRTARQEYGDQVLNVRTLGAELGKPKEEIQRIVDLLSDQRAKDFFKEVGIDARTFADGVADATKVTNELFVSSAYIAGIRQQLNQATNEQQWAAIARLLKDAAEPAERIRIALHDIRVEASDTDALKAAIEELRKSGEATEEELKALEKQFVKTGDTAVSALDEIGVAIGSSLSNYVSSFVDTLFDAEASFSEMAQSMLRDIAKLIVQMTILAQLRASFQNTAFGDFLGITPSALGNVFSGGRIVPFANGGVVNQPTIFPMANGVGLMGEAGPEAIMPLSRGADGKLGVKSQPVTVNVINNSGATATVSESEDSNGALRIDVLVENAVDSAISRGRFDKSLSNLYGLRRRGA